MSNRILLYTDNHFCSTSSILRKRGNKYTLRLENQLDTMNWLVDTAISKGCKNIVCLGDFFDSPNLNSEELACLAEVDFKDLIPSFIVGNHEMGNANLDYSSAHSFLMNQVCEVYNKPAVVGIGNCLIYILPYQTEVSRKKSVTDYFPSIEAPSHIKYKVLLMHNDIAGISMGKFVSKEGFSIEDLSNNFDLVVNGHLHNQSWVCDNVLNLGNITGQNFSEDSLRYKHQCMVLDCDTLTYELLTNPRALNFCKIDFTQPNNNIDYINKISSSMGGNCVASIQVNDEDYEYVRYRFDPDYNPEQYKNILPKNCNMLQTRISIKKELESTSNCKVASSDDLHVDYLTEFQNYIIDTLGINDIVETELTEILK